MRMVVLPAEITPARMRWKQMIRSSWTGRNTTKELYTVFRTFGSNWPVDLQQGIQIHVSSNSPVWINYNMEPQFAGEVLSTGAARGSANQNDRRMSFSRFTVDRETGSKLWDQVCLQVQHLQSNKIPTWSSITSDYTCADRGFGFINPVLQSAPSRLFIFNKDTIIWLGAQLCWAF